MPGIVMHHHFGQVVYCGLTKEVQEKIDHNDLFNLGLAGPDVISKINYFNKKKNEKYQDLNFNFHTQNTKNYFLQLIEETKKDYDLFSYLCGAVAHYFLDSITNPFIYYHSGVYEPMIDNTLKYRGCKEKLMLEMDAYCINNYYGFEASRFNIEKNILFIKKLDQSFESGLNNLYYNAYQINDGFKLINDAIKHAKRFYKMTYDPLNIKTKIFSLMDNNKSKTVYNQLTFYKKTVDIKKYDIFNMNSKIWLNPIDDTIKSNLSFFDLFDGAKTVTHKCINDLYRLIFKKEDINLDYYFTNTSYLTGLPCEKGCKMTFFTNNL